MGGTKIFVLQMKHIRKIALIAVAALAALILLALFLSPRNSGQGTTPPPRQQAPQPIAPGGPQGMALYIPGTYYSEIVLATSSIFVVVEVSETEILSIRLQEFEETQEVFYPLMQPAMSQLSQQIVSTQSLELEPSSESPYTQEVLIQAIRNALETAAIN